MMAMDVKCIWLRCVWVKLNEMCWLSVSIYYALWALEHSDEWWAAWASGMVFLRRRYENGSLDRDRGGSDCPEVGCRAMGRLPRGILWGERKEGRGKEGGKAILSGQRCYCIVLTPMLQRSRYPWLWPCAWQEALWLVVLWKISLWLMNHLIKKILETKCKSLSSFVPIKRGHHSSLHHNFQPSDPGLLLMTGIRVCISQNVSGAQWFLQMYCLFSLGWQITPPHPQISREYCGRTLLES